MVRFGTVGVRYVTVRYRTGTNYRTNYGIDGSSGGLKSSVKFITRQSCTHAFQPSRLVIRIKD